MSTPLHTYIITVRCPDQPGIVFSFAAGIMAAQGNILESAQFDDQITRTFCQRTRFESPIADVFLIEQQLNPIAAGVHLPVTKDNKTEQEGRLRDLIAEQDVVRVGHALTSPELATVGRDVERQVLSRRALSGRKPPDAHRPPRHRFPLVLTTQGAS